jgi:hypothetical protein
MRYVLCAPNACGFNDVMCQIWASYLYAQASNRSLLIDTRFSGLADNLSYYMQPRDISVDRLHQVPVELIDKDPVWLNQLSCYPKIFEGRIDILGHHFMMGAPSRIQQTTTKKGLIHGASRRLNYIRNPSKELSPLRVGPFLAFCAETKLRKPSNLTMEARSEPLVVHHVSGGGIDS